MSKATLDVTKVNALAELERLGVKYTPKGDSEVRLLCPVHEEKTPSVDLNTQKNQWVCRSCKASGDIISLIAYTTKVDRAAVLVDLSSRYSLLTNKILSPDLVERYHREVFHSGPLLGELYKRGITEPLIRKARLGYHNGRITIPIFDAAGNCLNVRHYLPGAQSSVKMKNTPGYGVDAIYQVDQISKYDTIWICGGEMKALAVAGLMNEHGVGAISGTSGEGNWNSDFSKQLKGKKVYICLDIDETGIMGARQIAGYIFHFASGVRIIKLPLDKVKYPKGDVNDYIGQEKATAQDLLNCTMASTEWTPPQLNEDNDKEVYHPLLSNATNAEHVNKWVAVDAIVSVVDTEPYLVPKDIGVKCDKTQPNCSFCPIYPRKADDNGIMAATVPSHASGILSMVNAPKKALREAIRESLRIPQCKTCEFIVRSHYKVLGTKLSPQLNIGSESSKNVLIPAFIVTDDVEMNTPYVLTGKVYPEPDTQQAVLLLNEMKLGADNLTSYNPSTEDLEKLKLFRPTEWTAHSIGKKLNDLYNDLETNVTHIYQRHEMHLAIDLVYHSPLMINLDGSPIKGWVEVLITGDTSNGKSKASERLMKHYQLGEDVNCELATLPGLLGGVNHTGNRYFVSWGVIPTHDRRLVILNEIHGAKEEVLAGLTDMRSKGIAEIPKIEKRRALARTRLLFIGNPRSRRDVSSHAFGVEIIEDLMVRPEDVRRLDFAFIVSHSQVTSDDINVRQKNRQEILPVHTSDLCQKLILWAWSRDVTQVQFEDAAIELILEEAKKFTTKFSDALPLVDRGSMREKIARLAASLAARTFSTSDDMKSLVVRACHVAFVCSFLNTTYSSPVFGYADFSKALNHANSLIDPIVVEKSILATKHPSDFVKHILYSEEISLQDLMDWMDTDRDAAQKMISLLVRKHAIHRIRRDYVKTPSFIIMLKRMAGEKLVQSAEGANTKERF